MLSKITSRWKSMMLSQKITGIILLLLFLSCLLVPVFNQITVRNKTKQAFIELCESATSATNNDSACNCAWDKAISAYGYDKVEKQIKYNGYVDPTDLFIWILDCRA